MQVLFENSYKLTDDIQLKIIKDITKRHMRIAYAALGATSAFLTVYTLIPPAVISQGVAFFLCTCILAVAFFTLPKRNLRILKRASNGVFANDDFDITLKFGEFISVSNNTTNVKYNYADIKTIYILEDFIVLSMGKRENYAIQRQSFVKGDFAQWKEFIAVQCEDTDCKKKSYFFLPSYDSLSEEEFLNEK